MNYFPDVPRHVIGRVTALLLLIASVIVWSACVKPRPRYYTPKHNLVESMGIPEAATSLQDLLQKAEAPIISAVQFGRTHFEFFCKQSALRRTGFDSSSETIRYITCRRQRMQIPFGAIVSIDIVRPEYLLVLRDPEQRPILTVVPRNEDEAHMLVDLLASFRIATAPDSAVVYPPLVVRYKRISTNIWAGMPDQE